MRTVRSKTLANAMDQKTRSNRALGKQNREQLSEESRFHKSREIAENLMATTVWKQDKTSQRHLFLILIKTTLNGKP